MKPEDILTAPITEVNKALDEELRNAISSFTSPLPKKSRKEITDTWTNVSYTPYQQPQEVEEFRDETDIVVSAIKQSAKSRNIDVSDDDIYEAIYKAQGGRKPVTTYKQPEEVTEEEKQEVEKANAVLGYSKVDSLYTHLRILDSRAGSLQVRYPEGVYDPPAFGYLRNTYGIETFAKPSISQEIVESNKTLTNLDYSLRSPLELSAISPQPTQTSQVNVSQTSDNFDDEPLVSKAIKKSLDTSLNVLHGIASALSIAGSTITRTILAPLVVSGVKEEAKRINDIVQILRSGDEEYKFVVTSSPVGYKLDRESKRITIGQTTFLNLIDTLSKYGFVIRSDVERLLWDTAKSRGSLSDVELKFSDVFIKDNLDFALNEYSKAPISDPEQLKNLDALYDKGIWGHSTFDIFEFVDKAYGVEKYPIGTKIAMSLVTDILTDPLVFISPVKGVRVIAKASDYILDGTNIFDKAKRALQVAWLSQTMTHDEYQVFKLLGREDVKDSIRLVSSSDLLKTYIAEKSFDPSTYLGFSTSEELLTELKDAVNVIGGRLEKTPKNSQELVALDNFISFAKEKLNNLTPQDFLSTDNIKSVIREIDDAIKGNEYNLVNALNGVIDNEVSQLLSKYKLKPEKLSSVIDKLQQASILDTVTRSTAYRSLPVEFFRKMVPSSPSDLVSESEFTKVLKKYKKTLIEIDEMTKDNPQSLLRRAVFKSIGLTREIVEDPSQIDIIKMLDSAGKEKKFTIISREVFRRWVPLVRSLEKSTDLRRILNSPDIANIIYVSNSRHTVYNLMSQLAVFGDLREMRVGDITKNLPKGIKPETTIAELMSGKVSDDAIAEIIDKVAMSLPSDKFSSKMKMKVASALKSLITPETELKDLTPIEKEYKGRKIYRYPVQVGRLLRMERSSIEGVVGKEGEELSEEGIERVMSRKIEETSDFGGAETGMILEMTKGVRKRYLLVDFIRDVREQAGDINTLIEQMKVALDRAQIAPEDKKILLEYIAKAYEGIDSARTEVINKANELLNNFKNSVEAEAILAYAYKSIFGDVAINQKLAKKIDEIESIIKGEAPQTQATAKKAVEEKPAKALEEDIPPILKEAMQYNDVEEFAQAYTFFVNRKGEFIKGDIEKLRNAIAEELREKGETVTKEVIEKELKEIKETVRDDLRDNAITGVELSKTGRAFFFIKEGTIETPLDDLEASEYFADIYNKAIALKNELTKQEKEIPQEVVKPKIERDELSVEIAVSNSIKDLVINRDVDVSEIARTIVEGYKSEGRDAILKGIQKIQMLNLKGEMESELAKIQETLINNADLFLIPSKEIVRRLYKEFDEALKDSAVTLSIKGKDINKINRLVKKLGTSGTEVNRDELMTSIEKIIASESKSKDIEELTKTHIFNFPLWLINNSEFREVLKKAKKEINRVISDGKRVSNLMKDRGAREVMSILKESNTLYRLPSISLWAKGLVITPNKNITRYLIPGKTTEDEVSQMMDTILEVRALDKLDRLMSILGISRNEIIRYTRGVQALADSVIPKTLNEKAKSEVGFMKLVMNKLYSELSNVFRNKTNELNLQIGHTLATVERALKEALRPLVSVNVVKNNIVQMAKKAFSEGKVDESILRLAEEIEKTDFGDIKALHIITALTENTDIFANALVNGKKTFAELFVTDFLKNAKDTRDLIRIISEHDGGKTLTMLGEALRQRLKTGIQGSKARDYILDPNIKPLDYIAFYSAIGKRDGNDIIEGLKAFSKVAELAVKLNATDEFDKLMGYFLKPADTLFIKTYGASVYATVVNKILHRASEMDDMTLNITTAWLNKVITEVTEGTPLYRAPEGAEHFKYVVLKKDDNGRGIFYMSPEYRMIMTDTDLSMRLFNRIMTEESPSPVIESLKREQRVLLPLIPRIISSKHARTQIELVKQTETGVKREMNIEEILSEIEEVEREFAIGVSTQEANIYHMLLSSARQSMPLLTFAKALGFNNDTHATEFISSLIGKEQELGIKLSEIEKGKQVVITEADLNKFENEFIANIRNRINKPMKLERIFVQNTLLAIAHKMALKEIIKNTKSFLSNPSVSKTLLIFGRSAMEYEVGGITEISRKAYIPIRDIVKNNENIKIIESQLAGSETPITMAIANNPLYRNAIITASKYSKDPAGLIRASIEIYKDYMQKVYREGIEIIVDGKKKTIKGMDAVINAMKIFYPDTISNKIGGRMYQSSFVFNMKRMAQDYLREKYNIEDTAKISEELADRIISDLAKKPNGEIDGTVEYLLLKLKLRRDISVEEYNNMRIASSAVGKNILDQKGIFKEITKDDKGNSEGNIWEGLSTIAGYIFAVKRGLDISAKSYSNELKPFFTNAEEFVRSTVGKNLEEDLPDISVLKDFENYISRLNIESLEALANRTKIPVGVAMPVARLDRLYDFIRIMNPYKDVGVYTYEKLIKEVKNLILPFLDIESYSKIMSKVSSVLGVLRRSLIAWFPSFYLQNLIDSAVKHFLSGGSLSSLITATSFLVAKYIDGSDEKLTARAAREILNTEWNSLATDKKLIIRFVEGDEKIIPFDELLSDIAKSKDTNIHEVAPLLNKNITDIIGPRVVKEIELNYVEEGRTVSRILRSYDTVYNGYSISDLYELASSLRVFNVGITLSISQDTLRDDISLLMRTYFNRMTKVGKGREGIMKDINKAKTILSDALREMDMQRRILVRLNGTIEQIVRFATFIDSIAEKGHSIPEALRRIDMWHFDYSTIAKVEKKYLNDIFFFWTFFRKTFELAVRLATTKYVFVGHLIKSRYDMGGEATGIQNAYMIPVGISTTGGIPKLLGIDLSRTFSILFPLALAIEASDSIEKTIKKALIIKPAVDKQLYNISRGRVTTSIPEHALDYFDALLQSAVNIASPFIEQVVSMTNPLIKLSLVLGGYSLNFGEIKQIKNESEPFYFFGTWIPISQLSTSVFSSVVRRNVFFGGASLETFLFPVSIRAKKIQEFDKKDISQAQARITTNIKRVATTLVSKEPDREELRKAIVRQIRSELIQGISDISQKLAEYKKTTEVAKRFTRRIINE
jgi:hypothetical protein